MIYSRLVDTFLHFHDAPAYQQFMALAALYRSYLLVKPSLIPYKFIFLVAKGNYLQGYQNRHLTKSLMENLKGLNNLNANFGIMNNILGFNVIGSSDQHIKDYNTLRSSILTQSASSRNKVFMMETLNSVFVFYNENCFLIGDEEVDFLITKMFGITSQKFQLMIGNSVIECRKDLNTLEQKKRVIFYDINTDRFTITRPRFVVLGIEGKKEIGFYLRDERTVRLFGTESQKLNQYILNHKHFCFAKSLNRKGFPIAEVCNSIIKFLPRTTAYKIFETGHISVKDYYMFLKKFCKELHTNFFICNWTKEPSRSLEDNCTKVYGTFVLPGPSCYMILIKASGETMIKFINPQERLELIEDDFLYKHKQFTYLADVIIH